MLQRPPRSGSTWSPTPCSTLFRGDGAHLRRQVIACAGTRVCAAPSAPLPPDRVVGSQRTCRSSTSARVLVTEVGFPVLTGLIRQSTREDVTARPLVNGNVEPILQITRGVASPEQSRFRLGKVGLHQPLYGTGGRHVHAIVLLDLLGELSLHCPLQVVDPHTHGLRPCAHFHTCNICADRAAIKQSGTRDRRARAGDADELYRGERPWVVESCRGLPSTTAQSDADVRMDMARAFNASCPGGRGAASVADANGSAAAAGSRADPRRQSRASRRECAVGRPHGVSGESTASGVGDCRGR